MKAKTIRTIAGLQRFYNANNRRTKKYYARPYILKPALERYLEHFESFKTIGDDIERHEAFRRLPSLKSEMESINGSLTPEERESLAQRDRAMHPRVRLTVDGQTLEALVFGILTRADDPWRKKAKEYWRPMIDRLRQLRLNPTLIPNPGHPLNERLEYDCGGKRRSLTPGQFENIVSKVRRRLSHEIN